MFQLFRTNLTGYKKITLITPLLIVLEVLCELALPLVMAQIVDVAIPQENISYVFLLGGIMIVLSIIAMVCGLLSSKYMSFSSQGFGSNLRRKMFDKIQSFSFADIDKFSSASLITRMTNDVSSLTGMLSFGIRMLVRMPFMLVFSLTIALFINSRLAVILAVVIPVMSVVIVIIMLVGVKLYGKLQTKIDNLNSTVQENLVGIRVVKAFVREKHERKKFRKSSDDLTKISLSVGMRMNSMMPIITLCLNAAVAFILYFGGVMIMNSEFTVGELTALINYISQVMMSVMMGAMVLLQFSRSQACAKRIKEVMDSEPSIKDSAEARADKVPMPKGEIQYKNVSFKYQTDGTGDNVLNKISFKINPGKVVAIVGGTGTGKSSLVNLLPRFYDVTDGQILIDGMDVRDYPVETLRERIGMVLQTNLLFAGTIRENLMWGNEDATEEDLIKCTKDAQIYEFIQSLSEGFDYEISQGGVNFSGGQKQRLCIARAMLKRPAILILDDSTSALDSVTETSIQKSFNENLKDTTVLIVAQRISSVQYADEILVLDDDHIVGQGTHNELLENCEVYQEIYQSQQEEMARA